MRVILTIISQSRIILEHYRSKACVVASCQNQRASEHLPIARADLSLPDREWKRQLAERSYDHSAGQARSGTSALKQRDRGLRLKQASTFLSTSSKWCHISRPLHSIDRCRCAPPRQI